MKKKRERLPWFLYDSSGVQILHKNIRSFGFLKERLLGMVERAPSARPI